MSKRKLVYYRNKYWYFDGLKDYRGELILKSIRADKVGEGVITDTARHQYRNVTGDEYRKQMEAIRYFQQLGVAT